MPSRSECTYLPRGDFPDHLLWSSPSPSPLWSRPFAALSLLALDYDVKKLLNGGLSLILCNVKHGRCGVVKIEVVVRNVTAGERVQMEYGVIGAKNGYKYVYTYGNATVQLEVYEYDLENLSETAQTILESVETQGSFELLEKQIPAMLSGDGRFMLIYTDNRIEKDEENKVHKEHVVECFKAFAAETE